MSAWYNRGKYLLARDLDWTVADVRVLLVGTGYTFSPDHDVVSDVVASELAGVENYVRKALAGRTVVENDVSDTALLSASDPVWTLLGACTIKGVVVYRHNAVDSSAELLMFLDGAGYPATHSGAGDWAAKFTNGTGTVA